VLQSPVERTQQEIDDGRRGKGCIFKTFCPVIGEAFTQPYGSLAQPDRDVVESAVVVSPQRVPSPAAVT
jgi:hypothetical protein